MSSGIVPFVFNKVTEGETEMKVKVETKEFVICFSQKGHHGVIIDGEEDDFSNIIPDKYVEKKYGKTECVDGAYVDVVSVKLLEDNRVEVVYELSGGEYENNISIDSVQIKCVGNLFQQVEDGDEFNEYGYYTLEVEDFKII